MIIEGQYDSAVLQGLGAVTIRNCGTYMEVEPDINMANYETQHIVCAKNNKVASVNTLAISKYSTCTHGGNTYQCDTTSQQRIAYRAMYAMQSKADVVTYPWTGTAQNYDKWRDSSNVDRTFTTADDFLAFAKAVSDYCAGINKNSFTLKDSVRACTSVSEVNAINTESGW